MTLFDHTQINTYSMKIMQHSNKPSVEKMIGLKGKRCTAIEKRTSAVTLKFTKTACNEATCPIESPISLWFCKNGNPSLSIQFKS